MPVHRVSHRYLTAQPSQSTTGPPPLDFLTIPNPFLSVSGDQHHPPSIGEVSLAQLVRFIQIQILDLAQVFIFF